MCPVKTIKTEKIVRWSARPSDGAHCRKVGIFGRLDGSGLELWNGRYRLDSWMLLRIYSITTVDECVVDGWTAAL